MFQQETFWRLGVFHFFQTFSNRLVVQTLTEDARCRVDRRLVHPFDTGRFTRSLIRINSPQQQLLVVILRHVENVTELPEIARCEQFLAQFRAGIAEKVLRRVLGVTEVPVAVDGPLQVVADDALARQFSLLPEEGGIALH